MKWEKKSKDKKAISARAKNLFKKDVTGEVQGVNERLSKDGFVMSDSQARADEREKQRKEKNLRMKHGKNWKQFTADVLAAKEREKKRLKPGEVRKLVKGKWVSNRR